MGTLSTPVSFRGSLIVASRQRLPMSRLALWLGLVVALAGCQQGARGLSLDPAKARESCTAALTAWKEGKKPADLKPAIIVGDETWDAGKILTAFEVLPGEENDGTNLHIPVELTLKNDKGKESKSRVLYIVGTSPVVTVFRR
jgi:hypothetical protein